MLRSARLLLRPPAEQDLPALCAIRADPGVARWWPDTDPDDVRQDMLSPDEEVVVFAIEQEGRVIGAIQYSESPDPDYRHAGIDLFIGSDWWGRGLGQEAIERLADHLFDDLGHHRIVIDPAAANTRAIRTYQRVGFRVVGVMRKYEMGHDGLLMEMLAEDRAAREVASRVALSRAVSGDEDGLLAMMADFNRLEGIDVDPVSLRSALSKLLAEHDLGSVWFFESAGGARLGYAVVTFGYDLEFAGRDAFLTEFYLLPSWRGKGLGAEALSALEDAALEAGARALHLMVRFENAQAIRLYRRAGYESPPRIFLSKRLAAAPSSKLG